MNGGRILNLWEREHFVFVVGSALADLLFIAKLGRVEASKRTDGILNLAARSI